MSQYEDDVVNSFEVESHLKPLLACDILKALADVFM